ncbi:hypothetical protein BpHYR1_031207 [Brachionus plicatilis]|uniref:Uncharacterized protein n=1 Tax=Brachionus plicatilis TaxID=10195 RepID=A0A3M7Q8J0_BRAPC|nr:hypothetical protein BpHYR1_031207 [Brachionus plicatilis]
MDIANYFEAKFEHYEMPKSNENWLVGLLDEFSIESINKFGKAVIHDANVYIAYSFSILDSFICSILSEKIKNSLNSDSVFNFKIGAQSRTNVCNTLGGGYVQSKTPDSKIFAEEHSCQPVIIKCAFPNESLDLLINECLVYLNEYTNNSYAIGFKVNFCPKEFKAYFFVFERMTEPDHEKIKLIKKLVHNQQPRIEQNFAHYDLFEFEKAFFEDKLSNFGIKVVCKKILTIDDLNHSIEFNLDKSKIIPGEYGERI